MSAKKRNFGIIDPLPSGKYRARYRHNGNRYSKTFRGEKAAEKWLSAQETDKRQTWGAPSAKPAQKEDEVTFGEYATEWLKRRTVKGRPLAGTTRAQYRDNLETRCAAFWCVPLSEIAVADVRRWYAKLDPQKPTMRARAYSLVATIFNSAVADEDTRVTANPCRIRGAGGVERATKTRDATDYELATITAAMPERYRTMVLLGAWCALRFGELTELRRKDIHLDLARTRRFSAGSPRRDPSCGGIDGGWDAEDEDGRRWSKNNGGIA